MTTPCGCTTPTPDTPVPANCNPIPPYAEPVIPETVCCMACVFDDLEANWVKPVGEATGILPVCDVTRFREDQCVEKRDELGDEELVQVAQLRQDGGLNRGGRAGHDFANGLVVAVTHDQSPWMGGVWPELPS